MVISISFVFSRLSSMSVLSLALNAALLASFTACSQPAETAAEAELNAPVETEAEVDRQGKKLELSGTASISVPPGAIAAAATLSLAITEAPVPVPSAVSNVLALTPHGTHFSLPVKVTLKYKSSAAPGSLAVVRLNDDQDDSWEVVGGVRFEDGVASFETTTFSYYAVVDGFDCTPAAATFAQCGGGCSEGTFCSTDSQCLDIDTTDLCANSSLYIIHGELPSDLVNIDEKQRADGASAREVVGAWAPRCGLTPIELSQAEPGVLEPCTDAPLIGAGSTIVIVGGSFGQRMARFLDKNLAPVVSTYNETSRSHAFMTRSGQLLTEFHESRVSPTHDYFLLQVLTEPMRGALVVYLYGMGWEGTPAGAWYFRNVLYPQVISGTSWPKYLLVEWSDDGDNIKGAGDTFNIIAEQ